MDFHPTTQATYFGSGPPLSLIMFCPLFPYFIDLINLTDTQSLDGLGIARHCAAGVGDLLVVPRT